MGTAWIVIGGLIVALISAASGWRACNRRWFDSANKREIIEGPRDEYGIVPAYRVHRVDMTPIEFGVLTEPPEILSSE